MLKQIRRRDLCAGHRTEVGEKPKREQVGRGAQMSAADRRPRLVGGDKHVVLQYAAPLARGEVGCPLLVLCLSLVAVHRFADASVAAQHLHALTVVERAAMEDPGRQNEKVTWDGSAGVLQLLFRRDQQKDRQKTQQARSTNKRHLRQAPPGRTRGSRL